MKKILVVEDDAQISDVVGYALEKANYELKIACDGKTALDVFFQWQPDLVILDIGLPEMDGLEVCREIRKKFETPILFLSAHSDEIDRILGLEMGGDDYVTKPFSPRELVARVATILKRTGHSVSASDPDAALLQKGGLDLDPAHRSAGFNGNSLDFTATEFNIMQALMTHPRMAFTRQNILTSAYPDNIYVSDRTIDSHIRNIRAKLNQAGCPDAVETVHGIGFRLGNCSKV